MLRTVQTWKRETIKVKRFVKDALGNDVETEFDEMRWTVAERAPRILSGPQVLALGADVAARSAQSRARTATLEAARRVRERDPG